MLSKLSLYDECSSHRRMASEKMAEETSCVFAGRRMTHDSNHHR
jgi:hypothetical protein